MTNYQLRVSRKNEIDVLTFKVEVLNNSLLKNKELAKKAQNTLENYPVDLKKEIAEGSIATNIELVPCGSLPKTPRGKPQHQVVDLRKNNPYKP